MPGNASGNGSKGSIWPKYFLRKSTLNIELIYFRTLINFEIKVEDPSFKIKDVTFANFLALGPPTFYSSIDRAPRGAESDVGKRLWKFS